METTKTIQSPSSVKCSMCDHAAIAWFGMKKLPLCIEHVKSFLRERLTEGLKPSKKE